MIFNDLSLRVITKFLNFDVYKESYSPCKRLLGPSRTEYVDLL